MKIADESQTVYLKETELAIIFAVQAGDSEACSVLYNRYRQRALSVTFKITRDAADAEDALQDCFLKVFSHLDTFDGRAALSTWITRIAINSALMILRKKRTRAESLIDFSDHDGAWAQWEPMDDRLNPEDEFLQTERKDLVQHAVSCLRPKLRDALQIHMYEEIRIRDVARLTKITVPAVKSRLLRARNDLHRRLANRI